MSPWLYTKSESGGRYEIGIHEIPGSGSETTQYYRSSNIPTTNFHQRSAVEKSLVYELTTHH